MKQEHKEILGWPIPPRSDGVGRSGSDCGASNCRESGKTPNLAWSLPQLTREFI